MDYIDLFEDEGMRRGYAIERVKILQRRCKDLFEDLYGFAQLLEGVGVVSNVDETPVPDTAMEIYEWLGTVSERLRKG